MLSWLNPVLTICAYWDKSEPSQPGRSGWERRLSEIRVVRDDREPGEKNVYLVPSNDALVNVKFEDRKTTRDDINRYQWMKIHSMEIIDW